jgi:hypothetical protein
MYLDPAAIDQSPFNKDDDPFFFQLQHVLWLIDYSGVDPFAVAIGNIRDTIKANWQDAAARRPATDDEWKFLVESAVGQMKIEQARRTPAGAP